ncbi:MAG: hypothetical protein KDA78_00740 [Planctomycetaceae bacterium]|nr:hypothetical protein [Planctomycetaceae bacterium]
MNESDPKNSPRAVSSPSCLLWLGPFLIAAALVASVRERNQWVQIPILLALGMVVFAFGYSTISIYRIQSVNRIDQLRRAAFLIFVSLISFVLMTRWLFPLPSTPDNDETRINGIVDSLLLWPMAAGSLAALALAATASNWRHALYHAFAGLLMLMLALSMHDLSKHWLRWLAGYFS